MNCYVFFTNSIRFMGGAQMYMRNKMLFLEMQGWHVEIFYYTDGEIAIPELRKFQANRMPTLEYTLAECPKKKIAATIDQMSTVLLSYDNVVIESNVYHLSFWGELLAKKMNGINLIYLLHERLPKPTKREADFFYYKAKRKELVMGATRIEALIGSNYSDDLYDSEREMVIPPYNNVLSEDDILFSFRNNNNPLIVSLGRLDKPYIMPTVESIIEYTIKYNCRVNLLFIGGSANEKMAIDLHKKIESIDMIDAIFLGYLYPIPKIIFEKADVAIASSGSVLVPYSQGVPTISIAVDDCQPLGVYGYTTYNKFVRIDEPIQSVHELLHEILDNNKYPKTEIKHFESYEEDRILSKHLNIIISSVNDKQYFRVNSLYNCSECGFARLKRGLIGVLGKEFIAKLSYIKRIVS